MGSSDEWRGLEFRVGRRSPVLRNRETQIRDPVEVDRDDWDFERKGPYCSTVVRMTFGSSSRDPGV